jgi:hypothetical protein
MDEHGFRKFLKRKGKKDHVINGLIAYVHQFESHLGSSVLEKASLEQATSFIAEMEHRPGGKSRQALRSLALYYRFLGREEVAHSLSAIRESKIATTRRVFRLRDFRDVDNRAVKKLATAGITSIEDMLEHGATPIKRRRLAQTTGLPEATILELVKLSDLARIGSVKAVRARLYYAAGVDTPRKLAAWEPDTLRDMLIEFIEKSSFDGIPPTPKEAASTIASAAKLPDVVDYDPE